MKAIVLFDTIYRNTKGIAASLVKEIRLHYNEI
jgi:hypothetical protein